MLTRPATVLLCVLSAHLLSCAANPYAGAIFISDGTANLEIVAKVTETATHRPVVGATVTAVRSGRGTTLLASDSTAMPPPVLTDARGRAVLRANFRSAADPSGASVFVARSFLRVQAPGFRSADVPIAAAGRLDFPLKAKRDRVLVPIALARE